VDVLVLDLHLKRGNYEYQPIVENEIYYKPSADTGVKMNRDSKNFIVRIVVESRNSAILEY